MSTLQERLLATYRVWKSGITISAEDARELSAPLLISVPDGYEEAKHRILFCGQETLGWGWTADYRERYPQYDKDYPYKDVRSLADFLGNDDAVEALCWGYREFDFSARQPLNRRGPFWQAFREVQAWPGATPVWGNLSRCAFQEGSIQKAPSAMLPLFAQLQQQLFAKEIEILKPTACLFFIGPNYDWLLSAVFEDVQFAPVDDTPIRKFARLSHPSLPEKTFRTYHPGSLSRQGLWQFIEKLKHLVID